jgi:hypothetical protein
MIAEVNDDGLVLNGKHFSHEVPLASIEDVLGAVARTIVAGPPEPYGHRNNRVHVFDQLGLYVNEHHARRLIGEVTFVFDVAESPFPSDQVFKGELIVYGIHVTAEMSEKNLVSAEQAILRRDLPGKYSASRGPCWVGFSLAGRRKNRHNRRGRTKFITRVAVSFHERPRRADETDRTPELSSRNQQHIEANDPDSQNEFDITE